MFRFAILIAGLSCLAGDAGAQQKGKVKQKPDNPSVLKVIEAIDAECVKNAKAKKALKGDELTQHLVRTAAAEALKLPEAVQHDAFMTGLGIGLDKTNFLAQNAVTKGTFGGIEADAAAKARQENLRLKKVSMLDRNDWPLHWALSIGLTTRTGAKNAEFLGLSKETKDLATTGWSFTDLNANFSGIEFAERIRTGRISLKEIETDFTVKKVLADPTGLDDTLTADDVRKKYGGLGSPSMLKEVEAMKKRVVKHFDDEWPNSVLPKKK